MTDIPFKGLTALSALATYILVEHQPSLLLSSSPSYAGTFAQAWLLTFWLWAVWRVLLYPKFFSPLRHLPSPPGGSWWNGHFARISAEPTGAPMLDW